MSWNIIEKKNYKLRYSSIDYITKIGSVMMWELTLDEWEKTVLLNSGLDASFLGMHDGLEHSISVDCDRRRRFESPRCRMFFSMMFHDKILLYKIN